MEKSKIDEQRLLEGVIDEVDNRVWVEENTVMLKLHNEGFIRKVGILLNDRFILYKSVDVDSYEGKYRIPLNIIEAVNDLSVVVFEDIYDENGMYRIPFELVLRGENLFPDDKGFSNNLFIPIEEIVRYKLELPEDKNRKELLGESWFNKLRAEFHKPYFTKLGQEIYKRRQQNEVYPDREDVFKAFKLSPFDQTKVVIIGQDPYFNGVADGLAFSSKDDLRFPPSLHKIYEALEQDIKFGLYLNQETSLKYLAEQGVLLLNTCLTVDAGHPNSHHGIGWEPFIGRVLEVLKNHPHDLVIMLWGGYAKGLKDRLENGRHLILEAEHPAYAAREHRKWLNKECFKKANTFLESKGYGEISW